MIRMSENTTMIFRIDKDLKKQSQIVANSLGIPISTLINAFLREMVATGRVEFKTAQSKKTEFDESQKANKKANKLDAYQEPIGPLSAAQAEEYMEHLLGQR